MIPIVLAADNNYIVQLVVVIGSIMITAKPETQYEIIIITDEILSDERIEKLKIKFPQLNYKIIRIDKNILKNAKIKNEGLSVFTYCRLFIPQILMNYEKCIYIDTDVVVVDDLANMYERDIDDYYVAGVKDYGLQTSGAYSEELRNSLEIASMKKYLNAGVLLMNLKKIRDDKISELFLGNIGRQWAFEDQDIINKCCYEKIDFLPVRYNVLYRYYKRGEFWHEGFYPSEDVLEAQERTAIIHYAGRNMKPWKFSRGRAAGEWWNIARVVLTSKEYSDTYEQLQISEREMQWEYIIERCQNREVIIWGAYELGKELYHWLINAGINIKCFCDNDEKKMGMQLEGLEVKSLQIILAEEKVNDYIFIVASQVHYNAIGELLKNNGIENVIKFFYKTEFYYMALDEKYFEMELKEIEEKEKLPREEFTGDICNKYWMDRWIYRKVKNEK